MSNEVTLPLPEYLRELALVAGREGARLALDEHKRNCPAPAAIATLQTEVTAIKIRFATLLGFMAGSGVLGGTAGALLTELLSK